MEEEKICETCEYFLRFYNSEFEFYDNGFCSNKDKSGQIATVKTNNCPFWESNEDHKQAFFSRLMKKMNKNPRN